MHSESAATLLSHAPARAVSCSAVQGARSGLFGWLFRLLRPQRELHLAPGQFIGARLTDRTLELAWCTRAQSRLGRLTKDHYRLHTKRLEGVTDTSGAQASARARTRVG
jgi:hypothetical protein